jgi:hypothetical protein
LQSDWYIPPLLIQISFREVVSSVLGRYLGLRPFTGNLEVVDTPGPVESPPLPYCSRASTLLPLV